MPKKLICFGVVAMIAVGAAIALTTHQSDKSFKSNAVKVASVTHSASRPITQAAPQQDPYSGWRAFTSKIGGFTIKYPQGWDMYEYANGEPLAVDGSGTSFVLAHSENDQNQFGMSFDLSGNPPADNGAYEDGTVATLQNGLTLWTHKQQDKSVAGIAGVCPDIQLVSGQSFGLRLNNGAKLSVDGSFCWNQKSNPTFDYSQQVNSQSFAIARQILASLQQISH